MNEGKIEFWSFIQHYPDEESGKMHIHLYMDPARPVETTTLNEKFIQFIPGEDLPRRNMNFRTSNFDNWYLYCLHDEVFLSMKGLSRTNRYLRDEFHSSSFDEFDRYVANINFAALYNRERIIEAAKDQMPLYQALEKGIIPPDNYRLLTLFKSIKYDSRPVENELERKYKEN